MTVLLHVICIVLRSYVLPYGENRTEGSETSDNFLSVKTNTSFLSFQPEHSHHLRSCQLRYFPAGRPSSEEPAAESPHDAGAAVECRPSYTAVRSVDINPLYVVCVVDMWFKTYQTLCSVCLFGHRENSQVKPGHSSRIRLPHIRARRRAEICIYCRQKTREPGEDSLDS